MVLERLEAPPIEEVVCGIRFEPIPAFDPILVGTYWAQKKGEFPGRALQPAIQDSASFVFGVGPLRSWLLSADESLILQLQFDRFYMNWRARGNKYPRFGDHGGEVGLLSRFLSEYESFSQFCETSLSVVPRALSIQVSKIDHLVRGNHWSSFSDIAVCVPWLAVFGELANTDGPALNLRFQEQRADVNIAVAVDTAVAVKEGEEQTVLKLEMTATKSVGSYPNELPKLRQEFEAANTIVNSVFEKMIPMEQRKLRFGRKDSK